jgi:4-amino-4-deoxy-L-arabinose transferase-like glycosyltransferase
MTEPLNKSSMGGPRDAAGTLSVFRAIVFATALAGALDATDGVVFFGLEGLNPIQVLQYIASGLLGAQSFRGGFATAGLGVLVHFAIALVVAGIYIVASRRISVLRSRWVMFGLLYGAAVWAVMNLVILPLTAVAPSHITTVALLNGVIGHALFVGSPIAFFAHKVEEGA